MLLVYLLMWKQTQTIYLLFFFFFTITLFAKSASLHNNYLSALQDLMPLINRRKPFIITVRGWFVLEFWPCLFYFYIKL